MNTIMHCWWQIIVAAIPYFILGAIWYNPKVLGSMWASGHGLEMSEEKKKEVNMGLLFGKSFISTLILCAVVCWVCCQGTLGMCGDGSSCQTSMAHCMASGFMVGLAAFGAMSMNYIYLMKPTRVFVIDGAYHIAGCTLAGIVLHMLGCC
jgi:hypothetical protein